MGKPTYTLTDAAKMVKEYPKTFSRPDDFRIGLLAPGDAVKLCFNAPGVRVSERMWVRITDREGDHLVGDLKSTPTEIPLKLDQPIIFETRHIYDLLVDPARMG